MSFNILENAESIRGAIENMANQAADPEFGTFRVSEEVHPGFVVWTVEMLTKNSTKGESLLKLSCDLAPDSFKNPLIEIAAADLLPFAKKVAQLLILVFNQRCNVCMPSGSDLYVRVTKAI